MLTFLRIVAPVLSLVLALPAAADMLDRLKPENLQALHEAIAAKKHELRPVSPSSGYDDVRALLHVHSGFSHDSRGTIEEILAAAKAAGVRVIMFSEHPANTYDYFIDGHRGLKNGVLLIPGAETGGFLAYPRQSIQQQQTDSPQAFADLVRSTGGHIFLCHLEERMDWQIANLTGSEIYNIHADYKDETRFLASLRLPLALFKMVESVEKYPQEVFGATLDYPADYLKRYDELCQIVPHTAVAGNDAHHNQAYRAKVLDGGELLVEDALGEQVARLDPKKFLPVGLLTAGRKPGDVILDIDFDPYERSFRHVSTHLLMNELTEAAVRDALTAGRAYVAFDWLADPTGFVYQAEQETISEPSPLGRGQGEGALNTGDLPTDANAPKRWPMGSEVPFTKTLRLRAEAPLEATFKLFRNGEQVLTQTGTALDHVVDQPGIYRLELWLTLAGEDRPWILTNPIYVRSTSTRVGAN
jgi:hypothetical protein